MSGRIVPSLEVFDPEYTVAAEVNLVEDLLNELCPELIHGPDDDSHEVVVRDLPAAVRVERLEQPVDVFFVDVDLEIVDALTELVDVKGTRTVVVHDLELTLQTDKATSPAALQLLSESLYKDGLKFGGELGGWNVSLSIGLDYWLQIGVGVVAALIDVSLWHFLHNLLVQHLILLDFYFLRHRRLRIHLT